MLVESGFVNAVRPGKATILIRRAGTCKSCSARGACMTFGSDERTVEVRDPLGASVGDEVQIGIPPAQVVWASVIAYIFPVLGMIGGALLGMSLAPPGRGDELAAAGAFFSLALCFLAIWAFDRRRKHLEDKLPVIIRVLEPSGPNSSEGR